MDPASVGIIGACVGAAGGLFGGAIGTYFAVKNTYGPRERSFAVKMSIIGWILIVTFLVAMFAIPTWHKHLLWIPYSILVFVGIHLWNRAQFRIRSEESQSTH